MVTAIVLYVVLVVVALATYSPALRRQIKALDAEGATSASYKVWTGRARMTGIISGVFALAIVFMLVVKPSVGA